VGVIKGMRSTVDQCQARLVLPLQHDVWLIRQSTTLQVGSLATLHCWQSLLSGCKPLDQLSQ
jgi:hypothetical protein